MIKLKAVMTDVTAKVFFPAALIALHLMAEKFRLGPKHPNERAGSGPPQRQTDRRTRTEKEGRTPGRKNGARPECTTPRETADFFRQRGREGRGSFVRPSPFPSSLLAVIFSTLKWLKKYRNQVFINTIVSDNIPPKCPKKGVFINRFRSVSIGKQQHSGCRARHANLILMRFRWTPLTPTPLPLPSAGRQTWRRAAAGAQKTLSCLQRCSDVRTSGRTLVCSFRGPAHPFRLTTHGGAILSSGNSDREISIF